MANKYAFEAEDREKAGKGASRALRREGKVPAVIYGDNQEPIRITLPSKEVGLEYNKGGMFTTLCDVTIGKDTHLVLARDIQLHPVTDKVQHVDFLRVTAKTKITVSVPVQFINEEKSPGIEDEKGILNVARYELDLTCKATAIPDFVEVDLDGAQIGDAIKLSNVKLPEGAIADYDRDVTVATINAPKTIEEEEAEEAAADAEGEEGVEGEGAEGEGAEGGDAEGGEASEDDKSE